jgi:phosphoribosyl 1,2-cyclic phosphodiesterase
MKLWMLGSGSRGNAVLLESAETRVLIDAGFPARVISERLAAIGVARESISAVVITHEHQDHVCGASTGARRWGWSVHATAGTIAACPSLASVARPFAAGATLELGELSLTSFATPHDAADPVAFVATARRSGARAGVVYDLGHASARVRSALTELDILVLESNHDEGMLRAGPYPPSVQRRIAGTRGHLGNHAAAELARGCVHRRLAHLVLAHLSEICNTPALATRTMQSALARTRWQGTLSTAPQHEVVGPFVPASLRARRAVQLSLQL